MASEATVQKTEAKRQPQPQRGAGIPSVRQEDSRPFVVHKLPLNSFHAQQIYRRGFETASNALYSLSVVLRFIGSDEQARQVEAFVDEHLTNTIKDLQAESARLAKLMENDGIDAQVGYSGPQVFDVKISSPRILRFLNLVKEYDQMVAKLDALMLAEAIDENQYSVGIYEWKRRLLRLANRFRTQASRAVIAARRGEASGAAAAGSEASGAEDVIADENQEDVADEAEMPMPELAVA